ncbi:MAG: hypothetical protein RLZZ385_2255 [Pseudomonadota bacterium]|jgi:heme exporter protein A
MHTAPDPIPTATLLSGRQLYCERDDRVLFDNLHFDLQPGEVLQVRGSNGSGKTTLLRILCGLNDSYRGDIYWRGQPLRRQREDFFASLLYMGHRVGVNRVLSPMENLRWACGIHAPVGDDRIEAALAQLGLRGFEHSPCHTLSAGQQQRVSLARLLVSPAQLWVLDEPFTTLDVRGVADLEDMLAQHVAQGGAVLVTTHHKLTVRTGIRQLNLDQQ